MIFWFWPLFGHLTSAVLGLPGDGTSAIRDYAAASRGGGTILSSPRDWGITAPQGAAADAAQGVAAPLQALFVTLAGHLIGGVTAWNLFILFGFAATALGTYVVLMDIGAASSSALLGGYIFAFNPWHFEKALEGHGMLVQTWVFPGLLWALVRLHRRPSVRCAFLVGAVIAASFYATAYFLLFAAVLTVVFGVTEVLRAERPVPLRLWLVAVTGSVAMIAPFAIYASLTSRVTAVGRPISDLQRFGADPLEYFVPSPRHPVFGHLVNGLFLASDPRHFAEPTLFFGLMTIALALIGLAVAARNPRAKEQRFISTFAGVLVVVAFVMSLPRKVTIASIAIPAPAWAIGQVTTLWRVYARFAVIVGFGLVVLASLGATYIQRRTRRSWLLVPIAAFSAFELAVTVPLPIWRTTPPAYVTWLKQAPAGIVAEYPMFEYGPAGVDMLGSTYFWQSEHHHPLFGVYGDAYRTTLGARAVRAAAVDLSSPQTPSILAAERVRYVVVHEDVYGRDGFSVPDFAKGLRVVWRSKSIQIAKVVARPTPIAPILAAKDLAITRTLGALPAAVALADQNLGGTAYGASSPGWVKVNGPVRLIINDPNPPTDWLFEMRLRLRTTNPVTRIRLLRDGRLLATATLSAGKEHVTIGPFPLRYGSQSLDLQFAPSPTALQPLVADSGITALPRLPANALSG